MRKFCIICFAILFSASVFAESASKAKEAHLLFDAPQNAHDTQAEVTFFSLHEKKMCAENQFTKAEVLACLANDEHDDVRLAVAVNPSTSPVVLIRLALDDNNSEVRRLSLKNLETARTPFGRAE